MLIINIFMCCDKFYVLMFKTILYTKAMNIVVYSDGSCFQQQGVGGWGVHMVIDSNKVVDFSGYALCKTSISMELLAVAKAFEYINSFFSHIDTINLKVYTDCDYIIKLVRKKEKAKRTVMPIKDKTTKRNKRIIFDICNSSEKFASIEWISVKAHSGIKGNDIADKLAKNAAKKMIKD